MITSLVCSRSYVFDRYDSIDSAILDLSIAVSDCGDFLEKKHVGLEIFPLHTLMLDFAHTGSSNCNAFTRILCPRHVNECDGAYARIAYSSLETLL